MGTKWTRERRSRDTLTLPNFDAFFSKWTNINASDYSPENYFQELLAALAMAVSSKHFVESHMYYTLSLSFITHKTAWSHYSKTRPHVVK